VQCLEILCSQTENKTFGNIIKRVQADVEGDTYFPEIDGTGWQLVTSEHHAADERHAYAFDLMVFERRPA
jgi:dihydrofolate reductase